jgi:hypothetical protein
MAAAALWAHTTWLQSMASAGGTWLMRTQLEAGTGVVSCC